ncbi:hypothetical protein [Chitinophaga deserti]|uniref:hypothetical protein n=1 Tax=Chitinophaga deserti TaxID=2164099 RepID=UPI000D6CE8DB|nr:hypothetical protein [Chitinophaga deserti]
MIPDIRLAYNQSYAPASYKALLQELGTVSGVEPAFRVAETPVFVPRELTQRLLEAGEAILQVIARPDFKSITAGAIPKGYNVPGENTRAQFIIIDFAVTRDENGGLAPKLIELQGFPSLFGFQELLAAAYRRHTNVPSGLENLGNGLNTTSYHELLRRTIVGSKPAEETILLEVLPLQQKTLIDFACTEAMLGIPVVCVSELKQSGRQLYFEREGKKRPVSRIYNRVIFEDLERLRAQMVNPIDLRQDFDVEWAPHPNWYYRISKYLLPHIHGPFAPRAWFLDEIPVLPQQLDQYVLKPLFSFAGQGVVIDPTPEDVAKITDPGNWILQEKVAYAPAVETPTGPAKCEIRLMYCWPDDVPAPILAHNLARLSKGKMIGVSYNQEQDWVGGSSAFFEY